MTTLPTSAHTPSTGAARAATLRLGVDLTTVGVASSPYRRASAHDDERIDVSDVARYVRLAESARADFVTFGTSFRLESGAAPRRDAWLDPAVVASRLADPRHLGTHAPALVPALPAGLIDPIRLAHAIAGLHARSGGLGAWQVTPSPTAGGVFAEILRVWEAAPDRPGGDRPALVVPVGSPEDVSVAGRYADVVRLRVSDPEAARALRAGVRTAAAGAGRDPDGVPVLVDALTVIADDASSAEFRADLIRDVGGVDPTEDLLTIAGTPAHAADVVEEWVRAEAADGVVVLPGSLPADVVALARDVTPELVSRGLLGDPSGAPLRARRTGARSVTV
ncbi:hypothetical protein Bcav_1628 [Beutenbergia cavernae DSM 12333]|uniref:Luciferase-like domain-containing protein n=1 Tax=Beutenbergia cavernae (strain ATCC BAA-8 / DSM 12333 / CCUG 43141 / JCM 11478 / NBRC 16432 / NCIMB 13614 / HKI 0122) TaxID=471853 RepID=C5C3X1_BEUC1|nr:LLM class flavin-dependent oxidoreductase [Beutenbergia cavernae]ACQ79884.1 hypothetical protein Bcav_1628 [Beutenbergia cavernae DSM 12333]